jgi:uncharacterized membrane protein YcjF (UPF0283 family)
MKDLRKTRFGWIFVNTGWDVTFILLFAVIALPGTWVAMLAEKHVWVAFAYVLVTFAALGAFIALKVRAWKKLMSSDSEK